MGGEQTVSVAFPNDQRNEMVVIAGPAWQQHSSSAADYRSDIGTTPTLSMLQAAVGASLRDSFEESPSLLEEHLASISGHEDALFCLSGTMANQIALRSHLSQFPAAILADHRSHIFNMEAGGIATVGGALVQPVIAANRIHLTLADIKRHIVLSDDIYSCPTRVISLETPHAGAIMPLDELRAISKFARENGVKVHIDGARLWEAVAAGAGSLSDFCSEVDSVSMCFTKGLCAPAGSILVGSKTFIRQARRVRKTVGGAMRQPGINLAICAAGLRDIFGVDGSGRGSLLAKGHALARELAAVWKELGGQLELPVQTNMVCLDLAAAGVTVAEWVAGGKARRLMLRGSRIVTHCQIERWSIEELKSYMRDTMSGQGHKRIVATQSTILKHRIEAADLGHTRVSSVITAS